jgi:hypothetical protein
MNGDQVATKINLKRTSFLLALLFTTAISLHAQDVPAAPVPAQLRTAKTVFLASGSAPGFSNEKATAAALYNSVYQSLAASGRYKLVSTPADAELSMTVTARMGRDVLENFLSLEIYDVKTQTLLWVLDEPVRLGTSENKSYIKNFLASARLFSGDLDSLANNKLPEDVPAPKP